MANPVDTKLYDLLGVSPSATENELKKVTVVGAVSRLNFVSPLQEMGNAFLCVPCAPRCLCENCGFNVQCGFWTTISLGNVLYKTITLHTNCFEADGETREQPEASMCLTTVLALALAQVFFTKLAEPAGWLWLCYISEFRAFLILNISHRHCSRIYCDTKRSLYK